jgi:aspartate/methionine/tyrosine aminotransferase
MTYRLNSAVTGIEEPPIAEAHGWIEGVEFPAERPLIDLAQAAPGYPPAEALRTHLAEAVMRPDASRYTDIEGLPGLRHLLATDIRAIYGGDAAADDVLIAAGCNQSFFLAAMTLARPGDAVMLPQPWYFNHRMTLDMLGIEPQGLPCRAENGFVPDPAEAERLLTPRTKAILLISPNNPTGAIYPDEVLRRFADLAARKGIPLILDETYRDFLAPGMDHPHGLFTEPGWREHFIHLYSFSKVYSVTGYRVGAVVAAPDTIREIAKVMDSLAICAPRIGQLAAIYGLEHLGQWRAANRDLMAGRVEGFAVAIGGSNSGFAIESIGAYFAFLRHPFRRSSAEVAPALARDGGLLTLPDTMFGGAGTHLRVAFANVDVALMPEVANRLAHFRLPA